MSNFIFIEKNIDISAMLQQVLDNPLDWKAVSQYENVGGLLDPPGFLPLVMAAVEYGADARNAEHLIQTELFQKYDLVLRYIFSKGIRSLGRAAFFKLKVGGSVPRHIDVGTYYLTKDRYHLSLQGRYLYEVDGEEHIIEPGTFFWFDNKKMHQSINISPDTERITFVFDSPYSPTNPHHGVKHDRSTIS